MMLSHQISYIGSQSFFVHPSHFRKGLLTSFPILILRRSTKGSRIFLLPTFFFSLFKEKSTEEYLHRREYVKVLSQPSMSGTLLDFALDNHNKFFFESTYTLINLWVFIIK
jgi:hypothetical protein